MFSKFSGVRRLIVVGLILSLGYSMLVVAYPIRGQFERLRRLSPGISASYFEWARDSRSFVLSESSTVAVKYSGDQGPLWYHYNLENNALTDSFTYPFLPQLTAQEETTFARTADTFFYLSPDGRFLVYVGEGIEKGNEERYWQLVIGDRQTQTTFIPEFPLYEPFGKVDTFDVRWSQDSHSFVLVACSSWLYCTPNVFASVRGLELGLSGMVFDWESISYPTVAGIEYQALGLIDASQDGTWALLTVAEDMGQGAGHWMMYNLVNPQSSVLITETVGQFATPDGSKMLYIDNQGIYRYDWANHTSTLLTTEVNNSKVKLGEFSPDGRWFVFVNSSRELYLFDLQGLPEAPTPTQPTSTSTPTLTLTPSFTPTLPAKFDKLRLSPACSPDPATIRVWRVRNLNHFDLPFTWEVQGNREQGSGVAPANGEVTFTTHTIHPTANVVRLFVQGKLQDVSTSTSAQCPTATPGG